MEEKKILEEELVAKFKDIYLYMGKHAKERMNRNGVITTKKEIIETVRKALNPVKQALRLNYISMGEKIIIRNPKIDNLNLVVRLTEEHWVFELFLITLMKKDNYGNDKRKHFVISV